MGGGGKRRICLALHTRGESVDDFKGGAAHHAGMGAVLANERIGYDLLFVRAPLRWCGRSQRKIASWVDGPIELPSCGGAARVAAGVEHIYCVPEETIDVLRRACTAFPGQIEGVLGYGQGAFLALVLLAEAARGGSTWLPDFRFAALLTPAPAALSRAAYAMFPDTHAARMFPACFQPSVVSYHACATPAHPTTTAPAPAAAAPGDLDAEILARFARPISEVCVGPDGGGGVPASLAPGLAMFLSMCHKSDRSVAQGRSAVRRLMAKPEVLPKVNVPRGRSRSGSRGAGGRRGTAVTSPTALSRPRSGGSLNTSSSTGTQTRGRGRGETYAQLHRRGSSRSRRGSSRPPPRTDEGRPAAGAGTSTHGPGDASLQVQARVQPEPAAAVSRSSSLLSLSTDASAVSAGAAMGGDASLVTPSSTGGYRGVPCDAATKGGPETVSAEDRGSDGHSPHAPPPGRAWCEPPRGVRAASPPAAAAATARRPPALGVEVVIEPAPNAPRYPMKSTNAPPDRVIVRGVTEGSAAEALGMRAGDHLVRIGPWRVGSRRELHAALAAAEGERGVTITYVRDGAEVSREWDLYDTFLRDVERLAAEVPQYSGAHPAQLASLVWNNELPLYVLSHLPPALPSQQDYTACVKQCLASLGLPVPSLDRLYTNAMHAHPDEPALLQKQRLVRSTVASIEADFAAAMRKAVPKDAYARALRSAKLG